MCSDIPKDKYVCVVSSKVADEPGVSGHIGVVTKTYADRYMPYRDNPVVWILPPTHVPTQTVKIMTVEKGMLRYSWKLRAGYWKLGGGSEAAQSAFEISVDGMTYFEYDSEGQDGEVNSDVNR